jgi:hypothetical protein
MKSAGALTSFACATFSLESTVLKKSDQLAILSDYRYRPDAIPFH